MWLVVLLALWAVGAPVVSKTRLHAQLLLVFIVPLNQKQLLAQSVQPVTSAQDWMQTSSIAQQHQDSHAPEAPQTPAVPSAQ